MKNRLVIFDCDGVLVDSESLTIKYFVDYLADKGVGISLSDAVQRYKGRNISSVVKDIETLTMTKVPEDFLDRFRIEVGKSYESELRPIPGIRTVLESLTVSKCVASNGPIEKMNQTLKITDLEGFFDGNIFSSYMVGKWKPDPDLFLHAASEMGFDPESCLVIEDSVHGVTAARRANMSVLGYACNISEAKLSRAGAITFFEMEQLLTLIPQHLK